MKLNSFQIKNQAKNNGKKIKKLALKLGIKTYQILTKDDEVCIPSRSNKGQLISKTNRQAKDSPKKRMN